MPPRKRGRTYASRVVAKRKRVRRSGKFMSAKPFVTAGYRNRRTAGFLGIETKFFDSSRAGLALTATAAMTGMEADPTTLNTLFAPVRGTGPSDRDGRKTMMKSVQINGNVTTAPQSDQTVSETAPQITIVLVLDQQTNAAQLNSEDVWTNDSGSSGLCTSAMRDMERSTRFRILKRWSFKMPQTQVVFDGTNFEQYGVTRQFSGFVKLNIPVEYVANGGTIADIQDNSLHLIACASGTDSTATIGYNCRIRFVG